MKTKEIICKHCGAVQKHNSFQCFQAPKKVSTTIQKAIPKIGKVTKIWLKVRKEWFKQNPSEYYACALQISPLCQRLTAPNETSLDHIIPRSARPDLRYESSNLQPSCYPCNAK
ncbi:MAG: HNH endonuclease, partial [Nitrosomonas sp.]|nr:HNH endonuclease [Nitrosomonas sp.]